MTTKNARTGNRSLDRLVRRLDRKQYSLDDALREITYAECILDGMGATEGKTLWGRIASIKDKSPNDQAQAQPPTATPERK